MTLFQLEGKDQEVSEVTVEQTETVEEKKEEVCWNFFMLTMTFSCSTLQNIKVKLLRDSKT